VSFRNVMVFGREVWIICFPNYIVYFRSGSKDMVELPLFERNLKNPHFKNWYSDDIPVMSWEGIVSNEKNEVWFFSF
jgi:hypothetical protein